VTRSTEPIPQDGVHPDLFTIGAAYVRNLPEGFVFTAADLGAFLPLYADDHSSRHGVLIRYLYRRGLIEFYGYGPARRPGDWDAPARHWVRTDVDRRHAA
jgi:hypothetical protein